MIHSDSPERPFQNQFVRPLTTAEQVADHCGLMIVDGRIAAGERVGEERLAEMCGVSRGPVREALRILEKRRLIEIIPRRGAFVRAVSLDSIADLFNVRNALAAMAAGSMATLVAAGQAAKELDRLQRRTDEIREMTQDPACHPLDFSFQMTRYVFAVILGSGNLLLLDMWGELNENTFWTTIWKVPQDGRTMEERKLRLAQMEKVLAQIRDGDATQAEIRMRQSLDDIRDRVLTNLKSSRPSGIR